MPSTNKIFLLSYEYPPDIGGAGIVASMVVEILGKLGHDVFVITKRNQKRIADQVRNLYQIHVLPKIYPLQFLLESLRRGVSSSEYIILNDVAGFLVGGIFFTRALQKKCILYMHGGEIDELFIHPSFLNRLIGFSSRMFRLLKRCKRIIYVSDFYKNKFLSYFHDESLSEKSVVIHNCYNKDVFYRSTTNLRSLYGISSNAILLLSAGRIVKGKGYIHMLHIFADLIGHGCDCRWFIIGTGDQLPIIRSEAARLKVLSKIIFLTQIPRDTLKEYYSSVDLFWLLSDLEESFGLVFIEAAACGTPSLGRNRYGMRESIGDKVSGFLVNSDHECFRIIQSRTFTELQISSILEFAHSFQMCKMVPAISDIFSHNDNQYTN